MILKEIVFDWYDKDKRQCLENVTTVLSFSNRLKYGLPITTKEYKDYERKLEEGLRYLEKTYSITKKDDRPKLIY